MNAQVVIPLEKKWMTAKELCRYLGVSPGTIARLRDAGLLTAYTLSADSGAGRKLYWYSVKQVDRFIESRKTDRL
jgi:excisionase family DNA binding protein